MATPWLHPRFARPLRVEILPDVHIRPISPDDLALHAEEMNRNESFNYAILPSDEASAPAPGPPVSRPRLV